MRHILTILTLLAILSLTPCAARGADARGNRASDVEIYSEALQSLRAARILEIEDLFADQRRSPRSGYNRKAATRAKTELKRLKSGKPLPRGWGAAFLRIEVNAPRAGQVGVLAWGEIDQAEKKKCTVSRVISASSVLAQTQWEVSRKMVFKSGRSTSLTGLHDRIQHGPPSIRLPSQHFEGPTLLLTNVRTAGLRPGMEIKTADIFVVEGRKTIGAEPAFVLRRLDIK